MKQQACIPRSIYRCDGSFRLAPSTGVERFKFTGESGVRPLAMRWAFVSTGAAPTATKAAKAATTKVNLMMCVVEADESQGNVHLLYDTHTIIKISTTSERHRKSKPMEKVLWACATS